MVRQCPSCGEICGHTKRKGCQYESEFRFKMTLKEAMEFAHAWAPAPLRGNEGMEGWRVVCYVLAQEVRRLRAQNDKPPKD